MQKKDIFVSEEELSVQRDFAQKVKEIALKKYGAPKASVRTFGCQQNVADSQKIMGMLETMGYSIVGETDEADLIIFNTCAVREHAEDRVFGNVGALVHVKRRKPDTVIALCGCMMQQEHIAEKIKKSFPHVDLVFGTHVVHKLPQMLYNVFNSHKRIFEIPDTDGIIAEGIPQVNESRINGWLPIMYGCNNFCTYCIVPYVRGRERSRKPDDILKDFKDMVAKGIKNITLLGQNVNSYDGGISFAELLRKCNAVEGDFVIRFMTSHPKDCSEELLKAMAECEKVEKHLHLPVQCGSSRVLKAMNRKYTREDYLALIEKAKALIPDLTLTSDIIVGFPSETYNEVKETVSLIEKVRYQSLFTFIYSKRKGTPAAEMPDSVTKEEKGVWFRELLKVQEKISEEISKEQVGKVYRVLIEERSRQEGYLYARTLNNFIVEIEGDDELIGTFKNVEITSGDTWIIKGKMI
ncbi:MAG: tRNA (N6-isopentenyl adenosine(37)-C2)-methylthiotransferase MiaB [Acutalibacteraceae bacterium]|nr:tRNA (N6-isopentenyl adenosine(37)-C2)-methylthiotransferase MiaB [Acutalibacteraceae bacterium]